MAKAEAGGAKITPIPIVRRLVLWSRLLLVVLAAIAGAAVVWSRFGDAPNERQVVANLEAAWHVTLLAGCALVTLLILGIRRLARHIERQVRYFSAVDALTGLANRSVLAEWLLRDNVALLYIDLDRFKVINDSLGHDTGDAVLKIVAQRIRHMVRDEDLVVRMGGDEFVVAVQDKDPEKVARTAAHRILGALRTPLQAERRELFVTGSVGIAVKAGDLTEPNELLRAADLALYRAKRQGRNQMVVFNQAMERNVLAQLDLESDLWRALDRGEMEVHYQPEINIESGSITGFEALVRWRHPEHGLLKPERFIGLAEENGALQEIGLWVIEESCKQWRRWREMFPGNSNVVISVNLSLRQLEQEDLADRVAEVLRTSGMEPANLKLEITESVLLAEASGVVQQLQRLRLMGIRLAIDDFGTGYSSLESLKQLPVHSVKIDQSFVSNMDEDDSNLMIVQAIVSLAHDLGLDVTAEGVETKSQLAELHRLGCDSGQGYYLSEPLPAETIEAVLSAYNRRAAERARSSAA